MSIANLVTALLSELKNSWVTETNVRDKKMRSKIDTCLELINSKMELSRIMVRGDPFHHKHKKADAHFLRK